MKCWRTQLIGVALTGMVWLGYALLGRRVARYVFAHFSETVMRVIVGSVMDAEKFVQNRLWEAAYLFSALVAVIIIHNLLTGMFLKKTSGQNARWIFHAIVGFVLVNLWLAVACHTTLFWFAFWQGKEGTTGLARFQIKYHLLRESRALPKAAIMGSSQAHRQVDDQLLNGCLAPNLHTGELGWPGARAYDVYLIHRGLDPSTAQIIIWYFSESDFYMGFSVDTVPLFFGFKDIPDCRKFDLEKHIPVRILSYGLLSDILPAFYLRDVLSQRILGPGVAMIRQRQHDATVKNNLDAGSARLAPMFQINAESALQKSALASLAMDCAKRQQRLVLIAGQLNPLLGRRLDPALRIDMLSFLRELQRQHPDIVLITNPPFQEVSDYIDLTHVNDERRRAFTQFVAEQLKATVLTNVADSASIMPSGVFKTTNSTP
jgi:hypothetical protein